MLSSNTLDDCIVLTNLRIFKIRDRCLVAEAFLRDIGEVEVWTYCALLLELYFQHQKNNMFRWDKFRYTTKAGKTHEIGIHESKVYNFFFNFFIYLYIFFLLHILFHFIYLL